MIVKILEFYNGEEVAEDGSIKWWFYGDLAKVSVSPLLKEPLERFREYTDDDVSIMFSAGKIATGKMVEYKRLICKRNDGSEFSIVFDTDAYLCNDKGETIEKIVVNEV